MLLSGWNKHLANYRFHDEPVEVDRQFALMLPNLVLSTHDFVRALYTLYSLINGDDEPTRILALRGLVRINSHRDTLHPYRLNTALRDMADGTGSILDRTATMALANLRFWDEESVADLLERAQLFYNGTFYKEALELVELALGREPENEDAWNLKALLMFNGYDNGDKALECLEHVVQAEGTHSGKLHFQGVINYFNGKYADALSYLESVIPDELSIDRQFSYHAIMALCLHGLNRVQEAEAYYLKGNELFERCDKSLSYVSYYKRCIEMGLSKCA